MDAKNKLAQVAAKQKQLLDAFLALRDAINNSDATEDQKKDIWRKFLGIYTGVIDG